MDLVNLQAVLPPPPRSSVDPLNWEAFEQAIGMQLSVDYKTFGSVYGLPGVIDAFLWVFSPMSANPNLDLWRQTQGRLDALRVLRASGESIPYAIFPEDGGLIPWGATDNGDVCYWRTGNDLGGSWTLVIGANRSPEWHSFQGEVTDFLVGILRRTDRVAFFPEDFPSPNPSFLPASS
jgi:hypothetical protein